MAWWISMFALGFCVGFAGATLAPRRRRRVINVRSFISQATVDRYNEQVPHHQAKVSEGKMN